MQSNLNSADLWRRSLIIGARSQQERWTALPVKRRIEKDTSLGTRMMFRKITSFVVAVSVMLLMQFADCYAMSLDQKSMQCCRNMPCNPSNKAHDCCKHMVSAQSPTVLPVVRAHFVPPMATTVDLVPLAEVDQTVQVASACIDPPQHSPPPLYIVYASLLI
jgi:hypothetical protein